MKSMKHSLYKEAKQFEILINSKNYITGDLWDLGLLAYHLCFNSEPFDLNNDINNIKKLIITQSEGL